MASGFLTQLDYQTYNVVLASMGHYLHYILPIGMLIAKLLPKKSKKVPGKEN